MDKNQKLLKLNELAQKGNVAILKYLFEIEEKIEKAIPELTEVINRMKGDKGDSPTREELLSIIEPLIPEVEDGKTPSEEELLELIRPLVPVVEDGKTPSKEDLLKLIKPLIPNVDTDKIIAEAVKIVEANITLPSSDELVDKVEKDLPKLGEPIRDSLELLKDEDRLDASAVKNLPDYTDYFTDVQNRMNIIATNKPLSEMIDVNVQGLKVNNVLKWNGQEWIPSTSAQEIAIGESILGGTPNRVLFEDSSNNLAESDNLTFDGTHIGLPAIDFDTSATITGQEGRLWWNDDDGTLNLGMKGGVVNQQVGLESLIRVKASEDISNGELIYIDGADGANPTASLAQADNEAEAHKTIAMATEDISSGQQGYATTSGLVRNLDTGSYVAGTELYLSPTTAGAFTDTEPTSPNYSVSIGKVIRSHASEGVVLVSIHLDIWKTILTQDYVPYTGATTDVDLGSNDITANNLSGTNTGDITVTDSSEIDFTLTGQDITASLIAGSIDETKLDTSVNASLDLADSSVQPADLTPSSGDFGFWNRTGTELTPATTDDTLKMVSSKATLPNISGTVNLEAAESSYSEPYSIEGTTQVKAWGYKDVGVQRIYTSNFITSTFTWENYTTFEYQQVDVSISANSGDYDGYFVQVIDDHTESSQNFYGYPTSYPFYYNAYDGWINVSSTSDTPTNTGGYSTACMIETNGICGEDGTGQIAISSDVLFDEDIEVTGTTTLGTTTTGSLTASSFSTGNVIFTSDAPTPSINEAGYGRDGIKFNRNGTTGGVEFRDSDGGTLVFLDDFRMSADAGLFVLGDGLGSHWNLSNRVADLSFVRYTKFVVGANEVNGSSEEEFNVVGDQWMGGDNRRIFFGTTKDMAIYYLGTAGVIDTGRVSPSDLQIDCGTDKTLEIQEPVWDDIQFIVESGKAGVANNPTWDDLTTNTGAYKFDIDDFIDLGAQEMKHDWIEDSSIYPHIHIALDGANASGSSQYAKFTIYLAYADVDGVYTETSKDIEIEIPTGTADRTHLFGNSVAVDLSGLTIGTQVNARVERIDATTGTEYPNDVFITQVGLHYEINTMGSRQIGTK